MKIDELTRITNELDELMFRSTGRTTRLVDDYVQKLFDNKGEWITIKDHYIAKNADIILCRRICQRLTNEHPNDTFEIGKQNTRIRITTPQNVERSNRIKELIAKLKSLNN